MTEKKIYSIWQTLTKKQKAIFYGYIRYCIEGSHTMRFYDRKVFNSCNYSGLVQKVEELGYAETRREINKVIEELGRLDFIRLANEKNLASSKKRKKENEKKGIPIPVGNFVLFSSYLTEEDKNLQDTFISKAHLAQLAIKLNKPDSFVLQLVDENKICGEELDEVFSLAVCRSSVFLVKNLVERGAKIQQYNKEDGWQPIMGAVLHRKDVDVLNFLLQSHCSVEIHDRYSNNLLHLAAKNPCSKILKRLVEVVPKEYLEEEERMDKYTPLSKALYYKLRKNQRILIKAGANLENARSKMKRDYHFEPDPDEDTTENIVFGRWRNCDFEWTPENTKRIIEVINAIDKKVNQMYDIALKMREFFEKEEIPKAIQKNYNVNINLTYESTEATPFADEKMMEMLYDETPWNIMPGVYFDSTAPERFKSRSEELYLNLNWDVELFDQPELEKIPVPYYVHMLFVDSHTYTLNDMMHMNPEDFYIDVEIHFSGDDL